MKKIHIFLILLVAILVVAAIATVKVLQVRTLITMGEQFVMPPITVSATEVSTYEWESTLTAIGSLEAAKGLVVTADLSGRITKIHFDAGSKVSAGDLLIEQDTSSEQAQLRAARSATVLAKSNFQRTQKLYQRKVASKSEYDNANNNYKSALAEADNIRAAIEKKSIRAPFAGRLGIRLVNLGQSIDAGQSVVSLQAADRMFVNFFLPQQNLPKLSVGLEVRLVSDAVPNKVFIGKVNAINPEIDRATRSIEIQAILENPNNELLPGMFANLAVVLPTTRQVLLIPMTAVQYATYGDSVFVVEKESTSTIQESSGIAKAAEEEDVVDVKEQSRTKLVKEKSLGVVASDGTTLRVRQQFIRLGKTKGDYVVVTKGLSEGDRVVSTGGFKLHNGSSVLINNTVVPDFSLTPVIHNQALITSGAQ